jgi:hypothetical protein
MRRHVTRRAAVADYLSVDGISSSIAWPRLSYSTGSGGGGSSDLAASDLAAAVRLVFAGGLVFAGRLATG